MLPAAAHCLIAANCLLSPRWRLRKGKGNRDLVVPSLGELLRGAGWRAVLPNKLFNTLTFYRARSAGLGPGVGRGLGVGPDRGVGVGLGVAVAVARRRVAVALGVAVAVVQA